MASSGLRCSLSVAMPRLEELHPHFLRTREPSIMAFQSKGILGSKPSSVSGIGGFVRVSRWFQELSKVSSSLSSLHKVSDRWQATGEVRLKSCK